jgi:hypothetical protein
MRDALEVGAETRVGLRAKCPLTKTGKSLHILANSIVGIAPATGWTTDGSELESR